VKTINKNIKVVLTSVLISVQRTFQTMTMLRIRSYYCPPWLAYRRCILAITL